jgi:hypothetical protein
MMLHRLPVLCALAACAAGCAAGCGGSYPTAPVSGKVTLDGKPLPQAAVTFQPVAEGGHRPGPGSGGFTDAEGRYTLKIIGQETRGAVVGKHRVLISMVPPETDPTNDKQKRYKQLPAKYSGKDTKLDFQVPAAGTDAADFELKSK